MGDVKFTNEQQKVIDARNSNLLVSAAAGSGKTAVLVERIIQLITGGNGQNPIDIDRLLVVTFTRAAAAQMKERITKAIEKKLIEEPDNKHLQRQETLIHTAQITTIDSFCQYVIRNNFNEIGLDPSYRVADEGEIKLLEESVIADFLEQKYLEADEEFLFASEYFEKGNQDKGIEERILQLFHFSQSMPWPEDFIKKISKDYEISAENFDDTDWVKEYIKESSRKIKECVDSLTEAINICSQPDGPYIYADLLESERQEFEKIETLQSYEDFRRSLFLMEFKRLSTKKDDAISPYKREMVKSIRDNVKSVRKDLQEKYFALDKETIIDNSAVAQRALNELCRLTLEFLERLDNEKREQNIIDFGDMEHFALNILVSKDEEKGGYNPTDVALSYSEFYKEILIDEYQDSNMVQELILSSIASKKEECFDRFMVGDVKQSIYSFRKARPQIFMDKLYTYDKSDEAKERRIDLHKNFRSRKEVLDVVNFIFKRIMGNDLGGVFYDRDAMLEAGATYPVYESEEENSRKFATEFWFIQKDDSSSDDEDEDDTQNEESAWGMEDTKTITPDTKLSPRQQEAMLISKRIKELLKDGMVSDGNGGFRKVLKKDIVILLRTTAGWDDTFRKILESEGIPAYVESRTGYFSAIEVSTLLNLCKVIDNPRVDIPLVSVMHSYIGDFSNEELARIKAFVKAYDRKMRALKNKEQVEEISDKEETEIKENEEGNEEGNEELDSGRTFYENLLLIEKAKDFINKDIVESQEKEETPGKADSGNTKVALEYALVNDIDFFACLADKICAFLAFIRDLRKKSFYMPVHELLEYIVGSTGYRDYVTAMPGGVRRKANVEMLMERARSFERTSFRGLFHFVRYIEELQKYEVDFGEANVLDENADVVRIMSIHKSKGLEFPIVFVAGLSKRFNTLDAMQPVLLDEDMGVGMKAVDLGLRCISNTPRWSMISGKMKRDQLGEELRVLYVAMTRAKEKLIMVSQVKNLEKRIEANIVLSMQKGPKEQEQLLPFSARNGAGNYQSLILMALSTHPAIRNFGTELGVDMSLMKADDGSKLTIPPIKLYAIPESEIKAQIVVEQVDAAIRKERLSEEAVFEDGYEELRKKLERNFSFEYSHKAYENLFTKTTVTELKKASYVEETEPVYEMIKNAEEKEIVPNFIQEKQEIKGAKRGTAYHKVMELLDAEVLEIDNISEKEIFKWMLKKEKEGKMEEGYARSVHARDIETFLNSETGKRFKEAFKASRLKREKQFMMGIEARRIDEKLPEGELVMIQGVIDVYFEEDDQIVLLDYKTDRVNTETELVDRYKVQLQYYKEAIERITHKTVKDCLIYSFALGTTIQIFC